MKLIPELNETQAKRFWNKVDIGSDAECWLWKGRTTSDGYGEFDVLNRTIKAHRVATFLAKKEQPGASVVRHRCDNPSCCNPNHLSLGTKQDNTDDAAIQGKYEKKGVTGCIGSLFSSIGSLNDGLLESIKALNESLKTLNDRLEKIK